MLSPKHEHLSATDDHPQVPRPLAGLTATLAYGAAANLRENAGGTLLYRAALHGSVPLVGALLAAGVSCAPCGVLRRTALHAAIHPASLDQQVVRIARLLLAAGVRADVTDAQGVTPLHGAARYGLLATARLLIAARAPVDMADGAGITPLHEAAQADRWDMCELLLTPPDSWYANRCQDSKAGFGLDHKSRSLFTDTMPVTAQRVHQTALSLA